MRNSIALLGHYVATVAAYQPRELLKSNSTHPNCQTTRNTLYPRLPPEFSFLLDGLPFVCGGRTYENDIVVYDKCYGYSPLNDSWREIGTLPSPRYGSGSAVLEGYGLVMAGGINNDDGRLDSVILTKDGSTFETLDSLPTPTVYGCLTAITQTTLLFTGGYWGDTGEEYLVYSYDIATNTWTRYIEG